LELAHKYNLSRSSIGHLVKKPAEKHHVKGWSINKLIPNVSRSFLCSGAGGHNYDHTIYSFQHSSGLIEYCTKYDLFTKYKLKRDGIYFICNGKQQSSQGWSLQIR
jgi:thiamine pyrophosphokinase